MPATQTIAVLGLGSIGRRHGDNFATLGCRVVGYDPDPQAMHAVHDRPIEICDNRNTALSGATAAVVCSPSSAHLDDLEAAIDAGCHALVEKPLGHQLDRAAALVARAEETGRVVAVGYNLRFHPCVEHAQRVLAAGDIGQPLWLRALAASYLPGWRSGQDHRTGYAADPTAGGVIMDFTHEIDLAISLLGAGALATATTANTGTIGLPTEDIADLVIAHDRGARTNIHVDYLTRPPQRMFELAGSDGFVRADLITRRFRRWDTANMLVEDTHHPGSFDDDYVRQAARFLDSLDGAAPRCTARDGLASLALALAARIATTP